MDMVLIETTVIVSLVSNYLAEKTFSMAADKVSRKIIDKRNQKWIDEFVKENLSSALKTEKFDFNKETIKLLTCKNDDCKRFKNCVCNSVFNIDLHNKKKIDQTWFVTEPPCKTGLASEVKENIGRLINFLRRLVLNDARVLKHISTAQFQTAVLLELVQIWDELDYLHEKLNEIDEYVKNSLESVSVEESHPEPSVAFTSREDYLSKMDDILDEGNTLYIHGFRGIGKTELCRRFVKEYISRKGNKAVWMDYEGDFRTTVNNQLNFYFKDSEVYSDDPDESFHSRISIIPKIQNLLIIIDDYVMDSDFRDILNLPCRKIVISEERTDFKIPSLEIGPLPRDDAKVLLRKMVNDDRRSVIDDNEDIFNDMLEEIDCHTATICRFASDLNVRIPDLDTVMGHHMRENLGAQDGEKSSEEITPLFMHLFDSLGIDGYDEEELRLMSLLSFIPESGMLLEHFEKFSGIRNIHNVLDGLCRKGYVSYTLKDGEDCILADPLVWVIAKHKLHPLISKRFSESATSFANRESQWLYECSCSGGLDGFGDYIDRLYDIIQVDLDELLSERKVWLVKQYTVMGMAYRYLDRDEKAIDLFRDAIFTIGLERTTPELLVCYSLYIKEIKFDPDKEKTEKLFRKAVELAESYYKDNLTGLASYYLLLTDDISCSLTDLELEYLLKTQDLVESGAVLNEEQKDQLFGSIAEIYCQRGDRERTAQYETMLDDNIDSKAEMGFNVALRKFTDRDYSGTIQDLERFLAEYGSVIDAYRCYVCHHLLALSFYNIDEFGSALGYFRRVIESSYHSMDENINPANVHSYTGICLMFTEQPKKALTELNMALQLDKEHPVSNEDLAEIYYYRGSCHYQINKVPEAYMDYQIAYRIALRDPSVSRFFEFNPLAWAADCLRRLMCFDKAIEEYLKAECIYEANDMRYTDALAVVYEGLVICYIAKLNRKGRKLYKEKLKKLKKGV